MKKIMIACILMMLLISCGPNQHEQFMNAYKEIYGTEMSGTELESALLRLEKEFQNEPLVLLDLAVIYLTTNQLEKAQLYLEESEKNVAMLDSEKQYIFYSAYADVLFKEKEYSLSLSYANQALNSAEDDVLGTTLIKARCLFYIEKIDDSLKLYNEIWNDMKHFFAPSDLSLYYDLLIEEKNFSKAVDVNLFYQMKHGYQPGLAFQEALLMEAEGHSLASMYASFIELHYQATYGLITFQDCANRLDSFSTNFPDDEKIQTSVKLLQEVALGHETHEALIESEIQNQAAFIYIDSLVKLMQGLITESDLVKLLNIESIYRIHPGYYDTLWRAVKAAESKYTIDYVGPILEKTVLLASKTIVGKEARKELGRLLGLSDVQSEYILLAPEVDDIVAGYISTKNTSVLLPLLRALALENNIYSSYVENYFKQLVQYPQVRELLTEVKAGAQGNLLVRLNNILNR